MGRDIRLDVDFLDNLKTRKLIKALGNDGVVSLIRLWAYVSRRHPKGSLNGVGPEDLEDIAGWPGDPGAFSSYLEEKGWLERDGEGRFVVHDWKEHQPYIYHSDKRKEVARRGAEARWKTFNKRRRNAGSNAGSNAGGNAPIPSPAPKDSEVARVRATRFIPPTIDEVVAYCEERENNVDPYLFHAKYTANGWLLGNNQKMKNWKATVVTWERREHERTFQKR